MQNNKANDQKVSYSTATILLNGHKKRPVTITITGRFIHSVLSLSVSLSLRLSRLTHISATSHRHR